MQLPSLESFLSYTRVKGSDRCFGSTSSRPEHRISVLHGRRTMQFALSFGVAVKSLNSILLMSSMKNRVEAAEFLH